MNDCSDNSKKDTALSSLIQGDIAIQIDQKRDTNQGQQDIAYAFVILKTTMCSLGEVKKSKPEKYTNKLIWNVCFAYYGTFGILIIV